MTLPTRLCELFPAGLRKSFKRAGILNKHPKACACLAFFAWSCWFASSDHSWSPIAQDIPLYVPWNSTCNASAFKRKLMCAIFGDTYSGAQQ